MTTSKRYRAAVVGGSGYGGAEMIRRLLVHPDVELVRVASIDFVGEPLSAADPALEQLTELRFEAISPGRPLAVWTWSCSGYPTPWHPKSFPRSPLSQT